MFTTLAILSVALALVVGEPVPVPKKESRCDLRFPEAGLGEKYYENIGHAIHSLTFESLLEFNKKASKDNHLPTVNMDLSSETKVLEHAPSDPVGNDFTTFAMNVVDHVLNGVGVTDDGLGKNWSPLERLVHHFHMIDLWTKIKEVYDDLKVDSEVCTCLVDSKANGVRSSVEWVAHHYSTGTPITLLNRPIPKLVDARTWQIWKARLLHYYSKQAVHDAAYYIKCSLE